MDKVKKKFPKIIAVGILKKNCIKLENRKRQFYNFILDMIDTY